MTETISTKIGCLAWGSLVWSPRTLKVDLPWKNDGPTLPVEYLRQSLAGHLTLVLADIGAPVTTLWTTMPVADLSEGVESLRFREGENLNEKHIGRWPAERIYPFAEKIGAWAAAKELDGVVWTALPPKFAGTDHRAPTAEEALSHLAGLSGKAATVAEEYVRCTPLAVRTPFRALFERELGWMPS
jgi:hypothetical protein